MKILSAEEIRQWDQFTITHEPITSLQLMERAAMACANWLMNQFPAPARFDIFCGKGNNGGDGLAIARLLAEQHYTVSVHILEFGHRGTDDFQANLERLHQLPNIELQFIQDAGNLHAIPPGSIIIDALFGSGLNRALEGVTAAVVAHINQSHREIISIDIPSGLFVDRSSNGNPAVCATHTLTFQCYKPAFLLAENGSCIGEVHLLDIGLHPAFYNNLDVNLELVDAPMIRGIFKPRPAFAHKGNFGHALLAAGSYGKMGAALLSARACLRSGVGLLTCNIPRCGYEILQSGAPEAMAVSGPEEEWLAPMQSDLSRYDAVGVGPGIGTAAATKMFVHQLLDAYRHPIVIDADALNIMAAQKDLLSLVPQGSILTPHPKEFERLFGETASEVDRLLLALEKAKELNVVIIVKGHHSFIATPDGKGFFNNTGNAGMATGGSGDVLTGVLTGLLAQGYSSVETAILGVYLHGLAGDKAAGQLSQEAMIAGDIVGELGAAFLEISFLTTG